ncbi:uncharacterized protein angptl8 [Megalobrama amblycephala]|uniref:uncharacterized protein angptl8 n=1 Tax=Megalobrama amblycephala TaxID=75352 RepID=UPI002013C877|nr:uncharacterized protein angptl8 [Megalobrama amblycephala]
MQAVLCVLFVTLCVNGVSTSPLKSVQAGRKPVSVDEVNILMYGVVQFSESLHHIYQSTEARLARVMNAISRTESEVKRLGHDTEEAAQTERQIKEKLQLIQAQMKALQIQVQENRGTVTRVELEEAELKKKLTSLEENLKNSVPDTIKGTTLKSTSILKDLMKWTQEQKLKLENQNQQLADLQKQNMV